MKIKYVAKWIRRIHGLQFERKLGEGKEEELKRREDLSEYITRDGLKRVKTETGISLKSLEFQVVAGIVLDHIREYVIPQYGDYPGDEWPKYEITDIKMHLRRYVRRIGQSSRGRNDEILDALKICHYAAHLVSRYIGLIDLLLPLKSEDDEDGDDTIVLKKDIVIPAGTVFSKAPKKTERYGSDHYSVTIGLTDDTSGELTYCIAQSEQQLREWFGPDRRLDSRP